MALPTSRNRTYAALSQLVSGDVNDLQDWIVNLYAGKHGDRTKLITPSDFGAGGSAYGGWTAELSGSPSTFFLKPTGTDNLAIAIPLEVGERIKELHVYVYANDTNSIIMEAYKQSIVGGSAPGAGVQLGSTQTINTASTNIRKMSITGLTETIAADTKYLIYLLSNTTNGNVHRFYAATVVYDRP